MGDSQSLGRAANIIAPLTPGDSVGVPSVLVKLLKGAYVTMNASLTMVPHHVLQIIVNGPSAPNGDSGAPVHVGQQHGCAFSQVTEATITKYAAAVSMPGRDARRLPS